MIDHARAQFDLDRPRADGRTRRQHLEAAARVKGRRMASLEVPPLPEEAEHLWAWFQELNLARTGSGFGPNPLSYAEIDAWARLSGRAPSPAEVQALRALDVVWLAAQAKAREEAQPKGPDASPMPPPGGPRRTPR